MPDLIEAGHYQRAKVQLDSDSGDARTLWLLSRAETGLGHYEIALKFAERAIALDPDRADYHVALAAAAGHLAEKASLFKQLGHARRAKKELDAALALDSENPGALYGSMLYFFAAPSLIGGDKAKAQEAADALTRVHPARGYLAQARLAHERKDPAAEEAFYLKSIDADPGYYDTRVALAEFYLTRGKNYRDAAEEQACAALTIDPGRIEAWNALAVAAVANQCWDELILILARAKEQVPDDLAPSFAAASAMAEAGVQLGWAGRLFRAYIEGPREGDALVDLARERLAQLP